jgi:hypothetical protein
MRTVVKVGDVRKGVLEKRNAAAELNVRPLRCEVVGFADGGASLRSLE